MLQELENLDEKKKKKKEKDEGGGQEEEDPVLFRHRKLQEAVATRYDSPDLFKREFVNTDTTSIDPVLLMTSDDKKEGSDKFYEKYKKNEKKHIKNNNMNEKEGEKHQQHDICDFDSGNICHIYI